MGFNGSKKADALYAVYKFKMDRKQIDLLVNLFITITLSTKLLLFMNIYQKNVSISIWLFLVCIVCTLQDSHNHRISPSRIYNKPV